MCAAQGPDVGLTLARCCEEGLAATLMPSDNPVVLEARFVEQQGSTLSLSIVSLGDLHRLEDLSLGQHCVVRFALDDQPHSFLSLLVDYYWDQTETRRALIELKLPEHISPSGVRRAYRVSVGEQGGVKVDFTLANQQTYHPALLNLSHAGALFAFGPTENVDLKPYDLVLVRLTLDDATAQLRGSIRRREETRVGRRYAVMFRETSGSSAQIPASLQRIVQHLEQCWRASDDQ